MTALCAPACMQEPPGRAGSYGDDVAEIADRIGRPMAPEQLLACDLLVAHDARGRFLSIEAGIEGPRQTVGKSGGIMLPIALWTALTDPDLVTWTAHLAETSLKQFADLCGKDPDDESGLISSCDWLRRRVRKVFYENGSEGVSFINGAEIAFRVRSAGRGRGMSGNTVIDDEFLFMTADQVGAQAPVLATRSLHGNARAYRASSSAKAKSSELRRLRQRAVAGDPTLTYVGWWARGGWDDPGCESASCLHEVGSAGCALDDEDLLRSCNPLLGRLVSLDFLRSMRATMTPLEFGREFLGWEEAAPLDAGQAPVSVEMWTRRDDGASEPVGGVVFAVDMPPSRSGASIAIAGRRADGAVHVGLVDRRPGTEWVADRLVELVRAHGALSIQRGGTDASPKYVDGIVIDPAGPALTLVQPLREAGLEPVLMTTREAAAACSRLQDGLGPGAEEPIWHRPSEDVEAALKGAVRRDLGDGLWAFGRRKSAAEIDPLVAVANAAWCLSLAPAAADVASTVW